MNQPARRSAGFTLIELLVVIGIIVLLVAIALPLIAGSRRAATRMKTNADMGTIATALEEYKKDHGGQYPQVPDVDLGFAILARELVGTYGDGFLPGSISPTPDDSNDPPIYLNTTEYKPGDSVGGAAGPFFTAMFDTVGKAPGNLEVWAPWPPGSGPRDGLDGPGGRLGSGRKTGPYLTNFKVRGSALVDGEGKPILYFPSYGNFNLSVSSAQVPMPFVSKDGPSKYVVANNIAFFLRDGETILADGVTATRRMQAMLGDTGDASGAWPPNGVVDTAATPPESPRETGKFILWAPGPDGFYGPWWDSHKRANNAPITPSDVAKCDDVILSQ
jgi:prepilin-type N-terminal cleavage/methylation domain-containing protein